MDSHTSTRRTTVDAVECLTSAPVRLTHEERISYPTTGKNFDVFFLTVHHSIDLFHLPTLMHNIH